MPSPDARPNRLTVAVVEDEPLARERLVRMLKARDCLVAAELENGEAFLRWMKDRPQVDGLFLDIHMPGGTGFEILAELEDPPPVVFVTAFAEHALRAFDAEAVDYLLKPIYPERLDRALDRLRNRCVPSRSGPEIRNLLKGASTEAANPALRFHVRAGEGYVFLELRLVSHFDVEDEIVYAWAGGKRLRTTWTALSEVEDDFPEVEFLRIQRNILLRPEAVLGLRPTLGGRCRVKVSKDLELEVSRSATPRVR
ncbi:MAG TPA: LytTR family DNA-binding domain-containing protein, partial [Holophagaceae bacterium]